MRTDIKEKICLALDVEAFDEAKKLVDDLAPYVGVFKVGLQLYTAFGNEIIEYIRGRNANFFLDIKLMDIPNTVQKASENVVLRGANFFNVHCLGGLEMMKAAVKGARSTGRNPTILGVTILTSISQDVFDNELHIKHNVSDYAIELAKLAKKAGLTGVVASPHELKRIKEACGKDFKVLCPGIRPKWSAADDQKRIATPEETLKNGADYIVLGRAVTAAGSSNCRSVTSAQGLNGPIAAMERIYEDIKNDH